MNTYDNLESKSQEKDFKKRLGIECMSNVKVQVEERRKVHEGKKTPVKTLFLKFFNDIQERPEDG